MSQIANVYAKALYDLAAEENLTEMILAEMKVLSPVFATENDYVRLLSTPNLTKDERLKIVDDSFSGKVQPYLLHFMKLLTEKGYIRHFTACCEEYKALYDEQHGIVPVKAVTSVPMTQEQMEKLSATMEKITGKKIELHNVVDEKCMGGVRLDWDGKRVDDTVRHRLDSIHGMLKNTVL